MKKCSLCGGDLDRNKRCTFCGLDNTKNDDMYKHLVNQNSCKHEPLTHVHTESINTYRKESVMGSDKTKGSSQTSAKSGLAKILAIIAVIATLGSSVFEIIENVIVDNIEGFYSEEVDHDPYAYASYDLPETGMEYAITLEPGIYTVGVHIPEGTYVAEVVSGDYGMITINDYNNNIYMYENIGLLDEATIVSDLRLYKGGHFVVNTGIKITLSGENIQSTELFTKTNELTEHVTVVENMVAGKDFPAGVYDIHYVPEVVGEFEYGAVKYIVATEDYDYELSIQFGDIGDAETYHNVVLPEGTEIILEDLENITLIPSGQIATTDINDFYDTYQ